MFDIKEYFSDYDFEPDFQHQVENIDDDLKTDIESILSNRFDKLYVRDRYKYIQHQIEIIHPALGYPRNEAPMYNPDRIRNLLSFYPCKEDLSKIDKIVVRPRLVDVGDVELVALYLRKKRVLILYLFHPHYYQVSSSRFNDTEDAIVLDVERITHDRLLNPSVKKAEDEARLSVNPLWYILSVISDEGDDKIEKFFLKKENIRDKVFEILNDISFYYSRHGY